MSKSRSKTAFKLQDGICMFCGDAMKANAWAWTPLISEAIGGEVGSPGVACCSSCLAIKGDSDGLSVMTREAPWDFIRGREHAMSGALHHPVDVPHSGSTARIRSVLAKRWKHPRFVCSVSKPDQYGNVEITWPNQAGCGEIKAVLGGESRKVVMNAFDWKRLQPWLIERNVLIQGLPCSKHWADLKKPKNERKTYTLGDQKRYADSLKKQFLSEEERDAERLKYLQAQLRGIKKGP